MYLRDRLCVQVIVSQVRLSMVVWRARYQSMFHHCSHGPLSMVVWRALETSLCFITGLMAQFGLFQTAFRFSLLIVVVFSTEFGSLFWHSRFTFRMRTTGPQSGTPI